MSIYKVGDKVILGEHTNRYGFGLSMEPYLGEVATLQRKATGITRPAWYVDIDGGWNWWLEENFNQCPCKQVKMCVKHKRRP